MDHNNHYFDYNTKWSSWGLGGQYEEFFRFQLIFFLAFFLLLTGCSNAKKTPSEVVKAAYMAANAGKYGEASEYLCRDTLAVVRVLGEKDVWDTATRSRTITKIEILEERVEEQRARVYFRIYFKDGSYKNDDEILVLEGKTWKICY